MAKCNICGESAGWFKKTHAECVQMVTDLTYKAQQMAAAAVPQISRHKKIENEVESVVAASGVFVQQLHLLLVQKFLVPLYCQTSEKKNLV